jgi:hypothetical protein
MGSRLSRHLKNNNYMDSYGFLWIYYGFKWIPMDSYRFLFIPVDSYEFLWIPMDSYGTEPPKKMKNHIKHS